MPNRLNNEQKRNLNKIVCDEMIPNSIELLDEQTHNYWKILNKVCELTRLTDKSKIGSLKEMYKKFKPQNLEQWMECYRQNCKVSFDDLYSVLKDAVIKYGLDPKIYNKNLCTEYVQDLIYTKTHSGFANEKFILNEVSEIENLPIRYSTDSEDSKGIDAYINNFPVQVKPFSYQSRVYNLINSPHIIYYKPKTKEVWYNKTYLHTGHGFEI